MHLLSAKPGGFVDDEGIVDLDQSPAEIIILSAADTTLAAMAEAAETLAEDHPSLRLANWMHLRKPAAYDLYQDKVIDHARVVIVSLLGGQSYWPYGLECLVEWAKNADRFLIVVPGDDAVDPELFDASSVGLEAAHRVWRYLREGGVANSVALLRFIAYEYFAKETVWREPRVLPKTSLYMPQTQAGSTQVQPGQATLREWQSLWKKDQPVVALLFYRSHLQSANTKMFDELIAELQDHGLNPLPIAISSLKDEQSIGLINQLIDQSSADLILNTTGFASNTVGCPDLSSQPMEFDSPFQKPIPVLQLILSSSTQEDWQQSNQGLRSRDLAMQVVLPEMDGRIITRAISFKSQSHYSERCEIPVVRYTLDRERARFVAQLSQRYCALSRKPNSEKRVALILANYPTKDGRIGNGVGLDTPASTINILSALAEAGYPLENIPENGARLIAALLGAITNNPDTISLFPCWQSISIGDYSEYFQVLPEACQQAVNARWGTPEQDAKYRDGRLMLAGIRIGETFVGIQPARGYERDLNANYHDPDLVPPHSYLAFYFWLRHSYEVDAIIHVGKHGNLEWLPGKGSALSSACWPDIVLGPMPHFYPFIVNDPGEGAQAKRRSQAVIIDHLMPPMTRAETYGELAELESLVDEFYQARGMDTGRETWLRQQILQQLRTSNVLQELNLNTQANDDDVLVELDAYLCDIKEAQIRNGLHILGTLPDDEQLCDTLIALLRLPRGEGIENGGILHNLAIDLDLKNNDSNARCEAFNPLAASIEPWRGPRPSLLLEVSSDPWRTAADTRDRLEQQLKRWVSEYVLDDGDLDALRATTPRTATQLDYTKRTLLTALKKGAHLEIQSIIGGLDGEFVPPGPSGAPTRGRLDVLPTGRNFFSVDNRAIPSSAAWALGQRSAKALIERHLQLHGDFPKQIGISVWGTATMRTGGDDIAQAFALMGVKPIWAEGSQRVIDIEVIPTMQIGRPRVDVTLRVSGFFRDAFANVMKLFDTAVLAIARLEEPGDGNVIRQHIQTRQHTLIAEGLNEEQAFRQASYRVFGSKPGAYGAGLQGLIDERCWETPEDLAAAYLNWGGYAYGVGQTDGIEAIDAFTYRLSQLEVVVQNQDNREHDILDSDDYYQFQGGMSNAVKVFSGRRPAAYHCDHADPSRPKIRTLQEELNRVIRSRVLNPKWIKAMRRHGYKGAFEMAASVDYLFAYDATTDLVADYQYEKVADALVFDEENQAFLQEHNAAALEEMAERLLEASQRGLWKAPGNYATALQDLLLNLDQTQEGYAQ